MIISQLCKSMQEKERSTSKINKQCLFLDDMAEGKCFLLYTLFLFFNFSTVNIPVFIVSRCLKFILTAKISFILTAKYIKVKRLVTWSLHTDKWTLLMAMATVNIILSLKSYLNLKHLSFSEKL